MQISLVSHIQLRRLILAAVISSLATSVWGSPIPSATLKQMADQCRTRLGSALPNWEEAVCSCMEREIPRHLSYEEYAPLIAPGVSAEQRMSDPRYRGAMEECKKQALAFVFKTLAAQAGPSDRGPSKQWAYRPGRWKQTDTIDGIIVHVPPGVSADMAAKLRAMALPHTYTHEYCLSGQADPLKFVFNVTAQPPGVCSETVAQKGSISQSIKDECVVSGTVMPDGHTLTASIDRHVNLTGTAKGLIDTVDAVIRVERRTAGQTTQLRWIANECGTARSGN